MKFSVVNLVLFLCLIHTICSCSKSKKNNEGIKTEITHDKEDKVSVKEEKVTIENGIKTVYFPNSNLKKFQGPVNNDTLWNGRINAFNSKGVIISTSEYSNGMKNGIHQVFYSNGVPHYTGEHRNDTMVGVWRFRDENGVIVKEVDYDQK